MPDAVKYLNALIIAAAAVAMRWALIPLVGPDPPYATIIGAVALTVWMWGWGAAVVTAVAGLIGTGLIIARPLGTLPLDQLHILVGFALHAMRRITGIMPGTCEAGLLDALRTVITTGEPADIELADASSSPRTWLRFMIVKVEEGLAMSFSDITQTRQRHGPVRRPRTYPRCRVRSTPDQACGSRRIVRLDRRPGMTIGDRIAGS